MKTFEQLKAEATQLTHKIERATQEENHVELKKLKRAFHEIKLEQLDLIDTEDKENFVSAKDLIHDVSNRPNIPRYETGINALDLKLNGGIETGTFIQLAGQSFSGKTHLTLEILSNISAYAKTVFFNFEMGDRRIAERLRKSLKEEKQLNNFLIDNRSRNLGELIAEIKIHARDGVKFFAIDSKMKIEVPEEKDDFKKFGKITNQLSKIAQENDIIIFLINQMSEEDIKNGRLAFKGSGDQMYDTDIALFYVQGDQPDERTLICTKDRQDEQQFSINLKLNSQGKTVDAKEIYPVYETVYTGHETVDMVAV